MRPYLAQARAEIRLTLTQGESLLVTLGLPVLFLLGFDAVRIIPTGTRDVLTFLAPAMIALAVMATGLVSLSIATAFERTYGVLKRLGTTPLGRGPLLAAKITSVAVVEVLQVGVIAAVAIALGWHPHLAGWAEAAAAVILGTSAFSGLGLLMAGALKAELVLGLSNGLYVVMLFLGGIIVPVSRLPGILRGIADLLPSTALSQVLVHSIGMGGGVPLASWVALGIWAVGAPVAAAMLFRWD